MLGAPPVTPPVIMERLIVDGPGAAFLKANCPQAGLTMCRFLDRLPPPNSPFAEDAQREAAGRAMYMIFATADPAVRRALAAEQFSFALATLRYDPIGAVAAALRNTIIQLRSFGLKEFDYPGEHVYLHDRVPQPYLAVMEKTKAWAGKMKTETFSVIVLGVTVLGALYAVVSSLDRGARRVPMHSSGLWK
jgi:hypothetical protein